MPPSPVTCVPVTTRRDFVLFIRLPRLLYSGMRGFVPRLDFAEREVLDPKHGPFFRHGAAEYWLAWRDGKPVGRISAQIDHLQDSSIGMFGCLDVGDDPEATARLLGEAENWLKRQGRHRMLGPFTLSINGESGLLLDGQDSSAMTMMPWHPNYLAAHVAAAGLREVKTLLSYTVDLRGVDTTKLPSLVKMPQLPAAMRLRNLDLRNLDREAQIIAGLFNEAWQDNWGFVPITDGEVSALLHGFRILLTPECAVFVEFEGKPAAMALILPNLAELTGDFGGTLLPFHWAKFLARAWRKDYRSGRLILLGVAKHLRGSIVGAVAPFAMLGEFARAGRKYRAEELELSWILDDNRAIQAIIDRFGGRVNKRYGLFEKTLQN